jgi:8-oxo-dGTP diphosphatase
VKERAGADGRDLPAVQGRPVVEVAVGVVLRADGAVLFGQRVAGKPYAGWWEFPGGKLEKGESVTEALQRELHEELGIEVAASSPWVVREHDYPHAYVRLHFHRVEDWRGELRAREGQALRWQFPHAIEVAPLLPAAIHVVGWLRLPSLFAISSATELGKARFLASLVTRLSKGPCVVQLREPGLNPDRFDALFHEVQVLCLRHGAPLLVNSAHPASYWKAAGGVHLRALDLTRCKERPAARWVGASCHDEAEFARACALGVDYVLLGPVMPTASHPGAPGIGWQQFSRLAGTSPVPVYALGGLTEADAQQARRAGAHGIAMLRAAWR